MAGKNGGSENDDEENAESGRIVNTMINSKEYNSKGKFRSNFFSIVFS